MFFLSVYDYLTWSALRLGESIAANNAYREAQRESGRSVKRMAVQESLPTGKACAVSNGPGCKVTTTAKQTIDSLIEKLQSGLEVCVCVCVCVLFFVIHCGDFRFPVLFGKLM